MQKDILQQISYSIPILNMALSGGYSVWDFSGSNPPGGRININGKVFSYAEMCQYALECKRTGRYAEAVGGYVRVIGECKNSTGKIYVSVIRSYVKVLISVNAFHHAFSLVGTVLADMQQVSYVNQQEYQLFMGYFQDLVELSKMIIDRNDFSALYDWCANYSGSNNYRLQSSQNEIIQEFSQIRAEVRQAYGE